MMKFKFHSSSSIQKYMIVLIVAFVICSAFTNILFFRAINNISIESDLYQKIKSSSELKADIFPPTLYIVEADLLAQQIVNEENTQKRAELLEKMEKNKKQYFTYHEYWEKNISDKKLSALLNSSNVYVTEFYRIYDKEFLPALEREDAQAMQEIVDTKMSMAFEKHREIIDDMSGIIEVSKSATEKAAKEFADRVTNLILIVYIFSVIIIVGISYIILKKVVTIENNIVTSQHETAMTNQRLELIAEGLKKFKHNYDNTLASIEGFVLKDDMPGLRNYMEEIIAEKSINDTVNYFKLNFIDNPAITGLILSKMIYAEKLGVQFTLKVRTDTVGIAIKPNHLCEILGILLDNAIEAALESEGKTVSLKMEESQDAYIFEIFNSTHVAPDRSNMSKKGGTTKGENRGYGLWMVREILAKYNNVVLNTAMEEFSVTQELIVLKKQASTQQTLYTDIL